MSYTQVVALTDFTAGTTIVSSEVDANFTAIRDVVNALITGTNTINAARLNPSSGAGIGVNVAAVDYVLLDIAGSFTSGGAAAVANAVYMNAALTGASGDTTHQGQLVVAGSLTTQAVAEAITLVSTVYVDEPEITLGAGSSITTAASLYVLGAPTEASSNYAVFVDAGDVRLDGGLLMTGTVGVDVNPGSDADADLITVGVSGTPKMYWDESDNQFSFTVGVEIDAGTFTSAGGTIIATASTLGFYNTLPTAQQTGVAVSAAGIHAACVALGLFTA